MPKKLSETEQTPRKITSFNLPAWILPKLKKLAAEQEVSMTSLVMEALEDLFKKPKYRKKD